MGVTYKLRQDIVEFIVQTKRADASLSCRGLVGVVKDKFGVEVSKSSVNAVIKQFQLSGPIGRHSTYIAPKNFSIPQQKKEIMLRSVQTFLPVVVPEKPLELVEVPVEEVDATVDAPVTLLPDLLAPVVPAEPVEALVEKAVAAAEPEPSVPAWAGEPGKLYGRLGAAALWFAFKAACSASRLGESLARVIGTLPDGVGAPQCEALFFSALFSEHRPGFESDDLATLWRLSGLEDRTGRALLDKEGQFDQDPRLCPAVHAELAMAFTPARYFRLLTASGGRFSVEASPLGAMPLFAAVERGVDRIITNIVPLIADMPGAGLTPELLSLIRLMEGGDDTLTCLEVIGDDDARCAAFTAIPAMRRAFILRARLTDSEMARVEYDVIDNHRTSLDPLSGIGGTFFEGKLTVEGVSRPLRVVSVTPDGGGDKFTLLSNISSNSLNNNDVLDIYIRSDMAIKVGTETINIEINDVCVPQISKIVDVYREVDYYTRKFFLDPSTRGLSWDDMAAILYDLSGHIKENPKALRFEFELPQGYAHQEKLRSIVNRLNSALFKAADGRRILFAF